MPVELDDIAESPSRPWVRVTRFEGTSDAVDRAMQLATDLLVPLLRTSEGWQRAVGLRSVDGREGLVLSFWENHDALLASDATTAEVRKRAAAAGLKANIERLELLFDEH